MTTLADIKSSLAENSERPPAGINDLIVCIYGDKKVGKSTFAAHFEKPIFLDCEDALRTVVTPDGSRPNQISIRAWDDPQDELHSLVWWSKFLGTDVQREQFGYRTLIVDGLNQAYKRAVDHVLKINGEKDINSGALGYGRGIREVNKQIEDWFTNLRRLTYHGFGIVLTAHEAIIPFENNGAKFDKRVPLVSGDREEKGWTAIKPSVDMVIHTAKVRTPEGLAHVMRLKGNELIEAADPTPDGRLPEQAVLSFDLLSQLYAGTHESQQPAPVVEPVAATA